MSRKGLTGTPVELLQGSTSIFQHTDRLVTLFCLVLNQTLLVCFSTVERCTQLSFLEEAAAGF